MSSARTPPIDVPAVRLVCAVLATAGLILTAHDVEAGAAEADPPAADTGDEPPSSSTGDGLTAATLAGIETIAMLGGDEIAWLHTDYVGETERDVDPVFQTGELLGPDDGQMFLPTGETAMFDAARPTAERELAFQYQKIEWFHGELRAPDGHERRQLVDSLADGTTTTLWCRDGGIIASSTEGMSSAFATVAPEGTWWHVVTPSAPGGLSWCARGGGGMLVSHGTVVMLLCVDARIIPASTDGGANFVEVTGLDVEIALTGDHLAHPPEDFSENGAGAAASTSWCPEPVDEAVGTPAAATPVMYVCPDAGVIASSTEGATNDFWNPDSGIIASSTEGTTNDLMDSGTGGTGETLRCPGTTQSVTELLSSASGADPVTALRSIVQVYSAEFLDAAGPRDVADVVALLDVVPELRDLVTLLGDARLDGTLTPEILAAGSRPGGWEGLNDLELRAVLHQADVLAAQLDQWYSGPHAPTGGFKVEIEGVSHGAFERWLDARAAVPRLFDEADALFGTRTPATESATTDRADADAADPERTTTPPTQPARPTTPERPTTTTTPERPTTTSPERPTTTLSERPSTTIPERPATTAPDRPTAPERPTTTIDR